jgi:antirestriction protein ArdC
MAARNETTGTAYQGRNVARLLGAEDDRGYDESRGWAGYTQWLKAGRVVRKGEHGVSCMTVVSVTDDKGTHRKPRGFRVFHYDQTTELTADNAPEVTAAPAVERHPAPVASVPAPVTATQSSARSALRAHIFGAVAS